MLKHRGVQVLLILALYLSIAQFLPSEVHQGLYTISLFIKDLLMWLLPLTVGFFIAHAIGSFKRQAPLFIITLIIFEALSNFSSVWYAYLGGHLAAPHLPALKLAVSSYDFSELWRLPLFRPAWWAASKGAMLGLVLGCTAALTHIPFLQRVIDQGKDAAQWILSKVLGIFIIGSRWTIKDIVQSIKNLLPAAGLAFTSGCSISTMPWTIEGSAKNLQNPHLAKAIIPATTNIQQIGDCITNTFLCFLLYTHFFGHPPDFMTWATFSGVYILYRFATAAVLGGAIFIMIPIYESYLAFNAEMIAMIVAFNVILDPIVTSSNVIANGALCRVFEKVWIFVTEGILKKENSP
ncbi:MAG: cation:dicarboxylase symporter family transporter [Rhabdochlamydiaceae bacterium]